jgi:hypothetical protein
MDTEIAAQVNYLVANNKESQLLEHLLAIQQF